MLRRGLAAIAVVVLFAQSGCGSSDAPLGSGAGADGPLVGGTGPGSAGTIFDPCASEPKPGYDPKAAGLAECCTTRTAHCVPQGEVATALAGYLDTCAGSDSVCMPDSIIEAGGAYRPPACTSS